MNIPKLRGQMVEKGLNVDALAAATGIGRASLFRKLKDGEKFTIGDAQKIKAALNLTNEEANAIFFGKPVA